MRETKQISSMTVTLYLIKFMDTNEHSRHIYETGLHPTFTEK